MGPAMGQRGGIHINYTNATFSSNMHAVAARCMTWTTPMGLSFEHSPLFGARLTDTGIIALWGSLGEAKAPVESWRNHCHAHEKRLDFMLEKSLDDIDFSHLLEDENVDELEGVVEEEENANENTDGEAATTNQETDGMDETTTKTKREEDRDDASCI